MAGRGQVAEAKIETYVSELSKEDPLLKRIREESDRHRQAHGCDVHPSSPVTGRLLDVLVRATRARRVLEVGCGLGYSAIWLASALPKGGTVETIERDPVHARIARANFRARGLQRKIKVLTGSASSILSSLKGPDDFVFEDATFGEKPEHYEDLIRVLKVGGYIQFANWFPIEPAILGGRHLSSWKEQFSSSKHAPIRTRRFVEEVFRDRRLSFVLLPHVWKGMAVKIRE